MPPKPSDPHWSDIFEAGMEDALEGKPATIQEGHYWHGYTYGLAVLEKEREMKAKEVKVECTSISKKKQCKP